MLRERPQLGPLHPCPSCGELIRPPRHSAAAQLAESFAGRSNSRSICTGTVLCMTDHPGSRGESTIRLTPDAIEMKSTDISSEGTTRIDAKGGTIELNS